MSKKNKKTLLEKVADLRNEKYNVKYISEILNIGIGKTIELIKLAKKNKLIINTLPNFNRSVYDLTSYITKREINELRNELSMGDTIRISYNKVGTIIKKYEHFFIYKTNNKYTESMTYINYIMARIRVN